MASIVMVSTSSECPRSFMFKLLGSFPKCTTDSFAWTCSSTMPATFDMFDTPSFDSKAPSNPSHREGLFAYRKLTIRIRMSLDFDL